MSDAPLTAAMLYDNRAGTYERIAGYRLKEHASRRRDRAKVPRDVIKAAILYGRSVENGKGRTVLVLDRQAIKTANANGTWVCSRWYGLGVVVNHKRKTIITIDRKFSPRCTRR